MNAGMEMKCPDICELKHRKNQVHVLHMLMLQREQNQQQILNARDSSEKVTWNKLLKVDI